VTLPDLSHDEIQDLRDLLSQSPGLWPFSIVAVEIGFTQAVEACRNSHLINPRAAGRLRAAGYDPKACLPNHADILAILWGVRIQSRMRPKRGKRPPLQRVARDCGFTLRQAQDCLQVLAAHQSTPAYAALLGEGVNEVVGQ
jgi:hypothetical protein